MNWRSQNATYNVNGVNGRLPVLISWLKQSQPVLFAFRSLRYLTSGFPIDAIKHAGYGAFWQGQMSWKHVAILARGTDSRRDTAPPSR